MTYDTEYCDKHGISEKECLIHPKGPEDKELAKTQYQWIEETLAASTASFIVVCGHYPIYSVAEHGSTSDLVKNLKPMLLKYNVTSYMSGQLSIKYMLYNILLCALHILYKVTILSNI